MSNVKTDGLPPEMKARNGQMSEGAKQTAIEQHQHLSESPHQAAIAQPQPQPPAPVVRQPSLMDHTISLRQEVADLRQEVASVGESVSAIGQVTEAVGQAVGQLYAMFHEQTTVADPSTAYAQEYQEHVTSDDY